MEFNRPINYLNPDFKIKLHQYKDSSDVYELFKHIQHFVYGIYVLDSRIMKYVCVKFGKSAGKQHGERIVRQIDHLPGWKDDFIILEKGLFIDSGKRFRKTKSSHGDELQRGIEQLQAGGILPTDINKNDVVVVVWSLERKDRDCLSEATMDEMLTWAEGSLCDQFIQDHGSRPYLNQASPETCAAYLKAYPAKKSVKDNFLIQNFAIA